MMKKRFLAVVLVLALFVSLAACSTDAQDAGGSSNSNDNAAGATDGGTADEGNEGSEGMAAADIVVAGINLQEDQFSSWCALGYQAAAADYGVTMLHAISGGDPAKELELINTYATQGVNGIAIMPASEVTSVEALSRLNAETGIPISLLNTDTGGDFAIGGATTAHEDLGRGSGRAAAEYIRDELGGEAKIGVITFKSQYPEPATQRMDGFLEEVRAVNPNVELVAEAEAWVQDMGIQAAGDMLTANPDLDVIFACNDGGTVGTVMAVKNAGLAGQVVVFGIDGGEQQLEMLRSDDDILQAVTAQDAYGMGYKTMEILIQHLMGDYDGVLGETVWINGQVLTRTDPSTIDAYEELLNSTK